MKFKKKKKKSIANTLGSSFLFSPAYPLPPPKTIILLISYAVAYLLLPTLDLQKYEIIQYVQFLVWLLSLAFEIHPGCYLYQEFFPFITEQ